MAKQVATRYCRAMVPSRRILLCVSSWFAIGVTAACMSGPAFAGYIMSAAQSRQLNPLLSQRPMDVYVATGPADACGPGCSEWIAVEGRFDAEGGRRFREFLNSPRRRSLPVFFHS